MAAKADDADQYARHKADMAARSRARAAAGQEIGPLPPVENPDRRARCQNDPELFELTYFAKRFPLPFSEAHREMCRRLESCIRAGGLEAIAFMRGGGKTTIAECKVLKSILYGFRRFVVLLQATAPLATRSLKKLQRELETNDLLLADFPEVCYPIRRLDRSAGRQRGQKLNGRPTMIEWTADGITLPTVDGSIASGAAIHVAGITGAVKGLSMSGPSGEIVRPDLVLIDDAQTRSSAKSPTETTDREAVITDDVLALAGPETTIAAINLCTPIFVNDLSERFLDRERHPEWRALRTRMLERDPDRLDLWDEWAEIRRNLSPEKGTEFYLENREAMSAGAVVTWPARRKAGPYFGADGLELAMILRYTNPRAFHAEYQCEPARAEPTTGAKELVADLVASRMSGLDRLTVPRECGRLTAFFDPGVYLLWYAVIAWNERAGGSVIDYGCWPRQSRSWFEARDARPLLRDALPGKSDSEICYASLEALAPEVLGRTYLREGAGEMKIERCLVDYGWEGKSVFEWVRQTPFANIVFPSKGISRTNTARGVSEWKRRPGERSGYHWRLTTPDSSKIRMVQFDPDAWKSRVYDLLTLARGESTGLTFWGRPSTARENPLHEMIAGHCAAEIGEPKLLRGVVFDKWEVRENEPDNHLFDCLVGAAVASGVTGLDWSATGQRVQPPEPDRPIRYADRQSANQHTAAPGGETAAQPLRYADARRQRTKGMR